MSEKIEVSYKFSPLVNNERFKVLASYAQRMGDRYNDLIIICRDHWSSHLDTIEFSGFIDKNDSEDFMIDMKKFEKIANSVGY